MNLIVDKEIFDQFPNTLIGVLVVHNINNSGLNSEVTELLRKAQSEAVGKLGDTLLTEQPFILSWREAYRKFGAKPKDYPSSIENLLRRILKGEQLRHINTLVDIYNVISLKHFLPVGGEDLSKIEGNIHLTFAKENEASVKLLGDPESRPPHVGEVIYKDSIRTVCRRWNWKEADRTKLMEETKDAILVIEALSPVTESSLQKALDELGGLVKKYCGGEMSKKVLKNNNFEVQLDCL